MKIKIKTLARVVFGILFLIVVMVVIMLSMIDSIAKSAVEEGASYALQVDTRLDKMNVRLLNGQITMNGLHISNPEGFTTSHLMRSGRFDLTVRPGSLLSDTVEVSRFEIDGLDLNIEQKLTSSNIGKILDNLKRFNRGKKDIKKEGEGKKIKADMIVIKNVVAHFHLPMNLLPSGPVTVKVPEIKLENVSSDNAEGVIISELVARIIPAILVAVIEQSSGVVPADFLKGLDTQVTEVAKAVGTQVDAIQKQLEQQIKKIGEKGEKAIKEQSEKVVEQGQKALEEAGDAVMQLLGGKKKNDKPKAK